MLVKIDRSTIRLNPDANITHIIVEGNLEMSFEYTGLMHNIPEEIKESDRVFWTECSVGNIKGAIADPEIFDKIIEKGGYKGLTISKNRNIKQIPVGNQPQYIYDYLPAEVFCKECNISFPVEHVYYDYDTDLNMCPNGHIIEEEIIYEKL